MESETRLRTPLRAVGLAGHPSQLEDESQALVFRQLLGFALCSGAVWLVVISAGAVGRWLGVIFVVVLLLTSLVLVSKRRAVDSLAILVFLATIQPAIRTYATPLPYLTLDYFFLPWVALALSSTKLRLQVPTLFYGFYLLLEIVGIVAAQDVENARSILIPSLTIGAALVLVGHSRFVRADVRRLFTACLIGVSTLVAIIGFGYVTHTIRWNTESNSGSSGGMGPVQISMLLALGIIIFLLLADRVNSKRHRLIYLVFAIGIGLAMLLTFSRNGLYLCIIAFIVYFIFFSRISVRTILVISFIGILGAYLFQAASQIAGSAFVARYSDVNSNRLQLVRYGWEIFLANPILGEGTGNYSTVVAQAEYFGAISGAHNELIRAAAEHGIFGLAAWVMFAMTSTWLAFREKTGKARALRMTLLLVFFAYLFVNGLKLLIQPLILLMALSSTEF